MTAQEATAEVVQASLAAWSCEDRDARQPLLEQAYRPECVLHYPISTVVGYDGFHAAIDQQHQTFPGCRTTLVGKVQRQEHFIRWRWIFDFELDGRVRVQEGMNFAALHEDGRIAWYVGFFGVVPPA